MTTEPELKLNHNRNPPPPPNAITPPPAASPVTSQRGRNADAMSAGLVAAQGGGSADAVSAELVASQCGRNVDATSAELVVSQGGGGVGAVSAGLVASQGGRNAHPTPSDPADPPESAADTNPPPSIGDRKLSADSAPISEFPQGKTSAAAESQSEPSPPGSRDQMRLARAYLLRIAEPPAPALARFVAQHGPIRAAARIQAGQVPGDVGAETESRRGQPYLAEQDLATAARAGARLVIPEDDEWPAWQFGALDLARARGMRWAGQPLGLWVRGSARLADLAENAVAVVGARSATAYGEHVAAEFGHGLCTAGVVVVSGAAYGVDGAAHRGSLTAGGPTVAFLACGVDVPYPAGHATLLDRIAESGAVVSEYPPGTPPAKHRFLVRNRLIAAFGAGTVVVEAARRSGARNTAATAQAVGRLVMAVPGPVGSAMSVGCHELIRSGEATLTSTVAEVVETVGRIGADLAPVAEVDTRETDGLDEQALRVHDALSRRMPRSPEQAAVESGVPLDRVRAILPGLELTGLVERCETGWRRVSTVAGSGKRRGDA